MNDAATASRSPFRHAIHWGLVSGLVAVATMAAAVPFILRSEHGRSDFVGYTGIVLSALLVFFAVRHARARTAGAFGFGRAFAVGLAVTAISALCQVAAFQLVYFHLVPEYGEKFEACMIDRARDAGATPAKVEEAGRSAATLRRLFDDRLTNAALTFAGPLPVGLVASLLAAAILRRKNPPAGA